MPTYTYACPACSERFEAVQSIHDEPLSVCNACGAEGVRRVISSASVGIAFRGSGFYRTDSRAGASKSSSSKSSSTGSSSGSSSPGSAPAAATSAGASPA